MVNQTNGLCDGASFWFQAVSYSWEVIGITADPQSGKGHCADFTPLTPGQAQIYFTVEGTTDHPTDCDVVKTISKSFSAHLLTLDVTKYYLGINLFDSPSPPYDELVVTAELTPELYDLDYLWSRSDRVRFTSEPPYPVSAQVHVKEIGLPSGSYQGDWVGVSKLCPYLEKRLTVVKLDVAIGCVDEDEEENPGGFVGLNDNDSDGSGIPDKDEAPLLLDDTDLVGVDIAIYPANLPAGQTVELTGIAHCYEDRRKQTPAASSYPVSSFPLKLYVEGQLPEASGQIVAVHPASGARDRINYTVLTNAVPDTEPPVLYGVPESVTNECPVGDTSAPTVTARDDRDGSVPVTLEETTEGSCPTVITRTWSAVDSSGNEASETRTITINDTTDPVIDIASEVEVEADKDGYAWLPDFRSAAKDSCALDSVTQTPAPGSKKYSVGDAVRVTLYAVDQCGNDETGSFLVKIVCKKCEGDSCPSGSGYANNDSVHLEMSLGRMADGKSAGRLTLYARYPVPDLTSPLGLRYYRTGSGAEVIRSEDGALRQVRATQALVDIVTNSSISYDVRFYLPASAGEKNAEGLYEPVGVPYVIWRIEGTPGNTNAVAISEIREGATKEYAYTWDAGYQGWSLNSGNGGRYETRITELVDTNEMRRLEYYAVYDGSGSPYGMVTYSENNEYRTFPWGEERISTVQDNGGAGLTTTWSYYTDPEQTGKYARIEWERKPDGNFLWYDYDTESRVTVEARMWKDHDISPLTSNAVMESAWVVLNDYTSVDAADDGSIHSRKPRIVTEMVQGVAVAKTYFAYMAAANGEVTEIREECHAPTAAYGDPSNLRTRTVYYSDTEELWPGQVKSVTQPNGQFDWYVHEKGSYAGGATNWGLFTPGTGAFVRITTVHGTTASTNGIAYKTTKELTIQDGLGNEIRKEGYVRASSGYPRVNRTLQVFDEQGRLTEVRYDNGLSRSTTWSSCCGRESDVEADGSTTHYVYDTLGRLVSRTKQGIPASEYPEQPDVITTYAYDAAGNVLAESIAAGGLTLSTSNQYDRAGRLVKTVDAAGLVTTYAYEEGGRIVTITRPGGATEITEAFMDGRPKSITGTGVVPRFHDYGVNADGSQWTLVRTGSSNSPMWEKTTTDVLGQTVRIERPGFGGVLVATENEYNNKGQLVATRQLEGEPPGEPIMAATLYGYDELGNQIYSAMDVNGNGVLDLAGPDRVNETQQRYMSEDGEWWQESVSKVYSAENSAAPITNAVQRRRLSGADCGCAAGKTVSTDILGNETVETVSINPVTRTLTAVTDVPDSTQDVVAVTVNGLLQASTSKSGLTMTYAYDALGRLVGVTDPRTGTAWTHYNTLGQVDYTEDAAGNRTTYAYDPATGRRTTVTDALSNTVNTTYYINGQVADVGGATYPVAYEYDDYGRMTLMKTWRDEANDPDVTAWHYDEGAGLLTNKVYADGNGVAYQYDSAGRLTRRTWARGVTTDYSYDLLGQLTNISYSDSTPDVSYAYDRLGRQTSVAQSDTGVPPVQHLFAYNPSTLALVTETLIHDDETNVLARSQDTLGRPTGISLDSSYAVIYGYDDLGRFAALSSSVQSASSAVNYTYVPGSELLAGYSVTPGGSASSLTVSRTFEPHRNLILSVTNDWAGSVVSSFDYQNDAVGRRTSRMDGDATPSSRTNLFGYNARSELTGALMDTNTFDYDYDDIGNRELTLINANTNTYAANELNQYSEVVEGGAPATPLSYDLDGNLVASADPPWSYAWDAENRLVQADYNGPAIPSTLRRVEYSYDHMGRRIERRRYKKPLNMYVLLDIRRYRYDGWNMIQEVSESDDPDGSGTNSYVWGLDLSGTLQGAGGIGGLLSVLPSTGWAGGGYFPVCDANGNVTDLVDANGALVAHCEYDLFGNIIRSTGPAADNNPLGFSTKYRDSETGLIYYGFRYYAPETGRFLSRDPIGAAGGANLYAFVRNSPIDLVDILGLVDPELGVALAIGLGWDNATGPYISTVSLVGSAAQGLCDNLKFRGDVHVRFYTGGLGTTHGDRSFTDFALDLTGSLSATLGEGSGAGTSYYTLNYQTRSAVENTFQNSISLGQARNYNSALGQKTRVGFMGLRADNFFMQYNNDVACPPTWGEGTDHGWTGGGILGLYVGGGNSIETGFQDFTGDLINRRLRHPGDGRSRDGYYRQTQGDLSLNRAEWFLRYGGGQGAATLSISSPDWLNVQHFIHDYISPGAACFEYPEFRYSLTVEGEVKAKH
ncbi:MAG: hypothetical protein KA248_09290 [Kiritimatiellae bacterium]|nr:hypothetical protein [Kiritimatiellia bacterium]